MHTGLEETKNGFEKQAAYFAERARGGVGLIVTGGISPDEYGVVFQGSGKLTTEEEAEHHRVVTAAVHVGDTVAFVGGTRSAENRQAGLATTRALARERIAWVEGTHLFPMEKPAETAAAVLQLLA